jgi:hypothetical protein
MSSNGFTAMEAEEAVETGLAHNPPPNVTQTKKPDKPTVPLFGSCVLIRYTVYRISIFRRKRSTTHDSDMDEAGTRLDEHPFHVKARFARGPLVA